MHHPDTKKFLGFSAEDIDIARAKRKEHLVKMLPPAPVIEIGSYVRIKHPFNEATYQEPDKWRAQDDLYLVVGDGQPLPAHLACLCCCRCARGQR
eukprot:COSAG01_NODE_9507_length_2408_cov_1.270189_4_plen_95_part_00